jgi:hypothetical protein
MGTDEASFYVKSSINTFLFLFTLNKREKYYRELYYSHNIKKPERIPAFLSNLLYLSLWFHKNVIIVVGYPV